MVRWPLPLADVGDASNASARPLMAKLANATTVAKGTRGSVKAKVIGGAILLVILLQFMVIPQNGNVSIPVPTPTGTPAR
jgi:hypothetical protein